MIPMIDQIHAMPNSDTINTADTMTVTVLSLTSVISTQGTQRTPVAWVIPPSVGPAAILSSVHRPIHSPVDRRYIHTVGQSSQS